MITIIDKSNIQRIYWKSLFIVSTFCTIHEAKTLLTVNKDLIYILIVTMFHFDFRFMSGLFLAISHKFVYKVLMTTVGHMSLVLDNFV